MGWDWSHVDEMEVSPNITDANGQVSRRLCSDLEVGFAVGRREVFIDISHWYWGCSD